MIQSIVGLGFHCTPGRSQSQKNTVKLTATAYLLDQEKLISAGLERFHASIYQVKVAQIKRRTGIDLTYLNPLEVSLKSGPELECAEAGMEQIQLTSLDQTDEWNALDHVLIAP